MMRRLTILLAVAFATAFVAFAQLGSTSRAVLAQGQWHQSNQRYQSNQSSLSDNSDNSDNSNNSDTVPKPPYYPMIIMGGDEQALDSMGVIVWHRRAGMMLTSVPRDTVDAVMALDGIICAEAALRASACMDVARPLGGVDRIQAGEGLPEAYRGQDMLVGFADIGFDANHIAFAGRVKGLFHYDASWGKRVVLTDPQEIAAYATDSADMWHATHVANIMAGGYMGNGYYGVAPEADIAASMSPLDDVSILCGLEEIIALGKSRGQRPVINMSLSSNLGPHDGTDLMCRYLAALGDDAMLCLSAGNGGKREISASHLFVEDGVKRIRVNDIATWTGFEVNGITEFWGADGQPFEIRVEVYDIDAHEVVFASPWVQDGELEVTAEAYPEWGRYMQGEAYAVACVSPLNGRYSATGYYSIATKPVSAAGPWSKYYVSLAVRCKAGQKIDVFADASRSFLMVAPPDTFQPNADMSISDLATADGVMSVGMCGSRSTAPGGFEWNIDVKAMSPYSAYGLGLPTIAAPGYYVVSAISGEYMALHPDTRTSASTEVNGKTYWWTPDCGTSMSAPYAAGTVALWMQANPDLTNQQIIDIAVSTAIPGEAAPSNPRWGAGLIDYNPGHMPDNRLSGQTPAEHAPLIKVTPDGTIEVDVPARIYASDGRLVAKTNGGSVGSLPPGLYVIVAGSHTSKVAL
ncbi:MAG: S8 family serine peptidase [Muribaculaceae bacterium]|nr:S8 family serine peptidase [Muribaculaceae bacterium]